MTIEFARNVLGLAGANSTEFDTVSPHPVIDLMDAQRDVVDMGGTMRLGAYYAVLVPGSKVYEAYGEPVVSERHRHRYEFNNAYRSRFEHAGFVLSGLSPDRRLVEFMELAGHPFYLGTQAHPEFKSRPDRPHPLFRELIGAALARRASLTPTIPFDAARAGRDARLTVGGFRALGERLVHQGHIWRVVVARFESPDGATFERDVVRSPGAVGVVPLRFDPEGNPIGGAGASSTAPPSAPSSWRSPPACATSTARTRGSTAERELAEECGLAAGRLELLTVFHNAAGMTDAATTCTSPSTSTPCRATRHGPEEDHLTVHALPLADALAELVAGRLTDAKTVIGLLLAERWLEQADGDRRAAA